MKNVILCGMPGCGKTYLGERLAKHLGWSFVDTDQLIEKQAGCSCKNIVMNHGEKTFRELEKRVLLSLLGLSKTVVATGGGVVLDPANIQLLRNCGTLVYLKSDAVLLYQRIQNKEELPSYIDPKRPEASFKELLIKRIPLYEQCEITLDIVFLNEQEILQAVLKLIV